MDFQDFPMCLGKSGCESHPPPEDVCRPSGSLPFRAADLELHREVLHVHVELLERRGLHLRRVELVHVLVEEVLRVHADAGPLEDAPRAAAALLRGPAPRSNQTCTNALMDLKSTRETV